MIIGLNLLDAPVGETVEVEGVAAGGSCRARGRVDHVHTDRAVHLCIDVVVCLEKVLVIQVIGCFNFYFTHTDPQECRSRQEQLLLMLLMLLQQQEQHPVFLSLALLVLPLSLRSRDSRDPSPDSLDLP